MSINVYSVWFFNWDTKSKDKLSTGPYYGEFLDEKAAKKEVDNLVEKGVAAWIDVEIEMS